MSENFRPLSHYAPDNLKNKIILLLRLILDFQFNTIYFKLKKVLPSMSGKIIDVGCGNSPFEHFLDKSKTHYVGLDYYDSKEFNYNRKNIVYFDGKQFPFEDNSFDFLLCTEVLEHVSEPQLFINETYRVLNRVGKAVFSVPWSARFHYIPHDYYRYTPTTLYNLFKEYKKIEIENRGTDLTVISSKMIVFYSRTLLNMFRKNSFFLNYILKILLKIIFIILFCPIFVLTVLAGHLSILLNIGSKDDCLGYTIILEK